MDEPLEIEQEGVGTPAWAAFGDLMAGVLGAFVLVLAAALVGQLDLANQLKAEVEQRQAEQARREALERALAGPLADGRITLIEGRIGISGAVLFGIGSDQLHADGRALVTASAVNLPDLTCGAAAVGLANIICTCPPITAFSPGTLPL